MCVFFFFSFFFFQAEDGIRDDLVTGVQTCARSKLNACLSPQKILETPSSKLAEWLKPSGYFNLKAQRLHNYCQWYVDAGELAALSLSDTSNLRKQLLTVNGVGPETADDILLYAFERPVFVIDAYTRRLFSRLALSQHDENYIGRAHV